MGRKKKLIEPIEANFDDVTNSLVREDSKPPATKKVSHSGELPIGDIELKCFVSEDGERYISGRSMTASIGMRGRGQGMARITTNKTLKPYISNKLLVAMEEPTILVGATPKPVHGYRAEALADLCDAILEARNDKALKTEQEQRYAEFAEILVRSFARIGIVALIDEATGYQYDRKHDALRLLLEKYIADGMQKWVKMFPDSFFAQLDRLYDNKPTTSTKRPQYYGKFINKYIYDPIENGYLKKELDKLNITDAGKRKARFHQWLSGDGKTIVTHQIGRIEGKMEDCKGIQEFKKRTEAQNTRSIAPDLFDFIDD
jgi:hypothetical protein